jgi:hypothetical protein
MKHGLVLNQVLIMLQLKFQEWIYENLFNVRMKLKVLVSDDDFNYLTYLFYFELVKSVDEVMAIGRYHLKKLSNKL